MVFHLYTVPSHQRKVNSSSIKSFLRGADSTHFKDTQDPSPFFLAHPAMITTQGNMIPLRTGIPAGIFSGNSDSELRDVLFFEKELDRPAFCMKSKGWL